MQNQIKLTGYIKSYRRKLKRAVNYSDREYRLLDVLVHIVDWDKKHTAFGATKESLRDIQGHYLPNWSLGKLSVAMNDLLRRGIIERDESSNIRIKSFWKLTEDVHEDEQEADSIVPTEQGVQPTEQPVHPTAQRVQRDEQLSANEINDPLRESVSDTSQNDPSVQQREQPKPPKETLEKPIQHQTNSDEMMLITKLAERYGNDIRVPLRKFSVIQVRDAIRRMEARRRHDNERIGNEVGYITTLCKEGIRWEDSEEKRREDSIKAREEEERRKWEEMNKPISPEQQARNIAALKKMKRELIDKGWKLKP